MIDSVTELLNLYTLQETFLRKKVDSKKLEISARFF